MSDAAHLLVEAGVDKGRKLVIPAEGARLGRSSKNDITVIDPLLSRHHCRLFFKPGEGLWITDLGSANKTLVNGEEVQESRINVGDTVEIGDTILRVLSDAAIPHSGFDLGFRRPSAGIGDRRSRLPFLLVATVAVALIAIAAWVPKLLRPAPEPEPVRPPPPPAPAPTVEIEYEKVEADSDNVFRYKFRLDAENRLSVQIDDIAHDRHVRKEKTVDPSYARQLGAEIADAGFFNLVEEYRGLQPDVLESRVISVTLGRKTARVVVVNRIEPEPFSSVREQIERFGKMELGLWAIQYSPEKLVEMARDAYLLGKKLYDEREVKYGNLAAAIRSQQEADWYLETVEPKPEFYPDLLANSAACRKEIQTRYDDHNFRAQRAMTLNDLDEAARELRIIRELIPDGTDPRHVEARKRLIAVESRLKDR
ncbi:MAG: FHA domain-containing protein [Lentisphaerae bacterium]|nr:FHA domain-containing protein [Lentisphaerota bacterium]